MKLFLIATTVGAVQAFVAPTAFTGSAVGSRVTSLSTPRMSLEEYKEELAETAKKIAGPGEKLAPLMVSGRRTV